MTKAGCWIRRGRPEAQPQWPVARLQQYNIFYVAMKQPRAASQNHTRLPHKKPTLPSFRTIKSTSKVQELVGQAKSELFFNIKLLPLEVLADRRIGQTLKISASCSEIVVWDAGRSYRTSLPLNLGSSYEWVELNMGEAFHTVRLRKMGDENVFGFHNDLVVWDRSTLGEKTALVSVNIKEIIKGVQKKTEPFLASAPTVRDDRTKQMKAFVSNIMANCVGRKLLQKNESQNKLSTRKRSSLFKSKFSTNYDDDQQLSAIGKADAPSTACSSSSGLGMLRPFRKQLQDRNKLIESKFTGKSQKQTSIGDQSVYLNIKTTNVAQLSTVQNSQYSRKRLKFDSQPYFYQHEATTDNFGSRNQSLPRDNNFSRQEQSQVAPSFKCLQQPSDDTPNEVQCLLNKSEHKSQMQSEVEEDIKRSQLLKSSMDKGSGWPQQSRNKSDNAGQSSSCYESEQLQSSQGTIYQSRYQ